jgi:hypothetical protein
MYGIAAHPNNRRYKAAQSGLNLAQLVLNTVLPTP